MALGAAFSVFGIGIAAWGRITLVKGGTNVNPYKPTTSIISGGPFVFTRNPLYVGLQSLFIGLSLLVGTWWGLVLFVPAFLVLHYGVVLREEAYLSASSAKFISLTRARLAVGYEPCAPDMRFHATHSRCALVRS